VKHTKRLLSKYRQLITARSGGKHLSGYEHHASLSLCLAMAKAGEAARALVTLTPAVAGKRYFEDIAAVVNAGGPLDMAKVKAVMDKYGLVVA
jgi:hypothetical protein